MMTQTDFIEIAKKEKEGFYHFLRNDKQRKDYYHKQVLPVIKKRAERDRKNAELMRSGHEDYFNKLEELIKNNYRQYEGRWAGGNNYYTIRIQAPYGVRVNSFTEWSSNGKWNGLSGHFYLDVANPRSNQKLIVDGLVNIRSVEIEKNIFSATWLEQGRGCNLKSIKGYIAVHGKYSFHGKTIQSAKTGLTRKRKSIVQKKINEKLHEKLRKTVKINFETAKNAGLCETGIINFCNKRGIDINGEITGQELLKLKLNGNAKDVNRVIEYAVASHS